MFYFTTYCSNNWSSFLFMLQKRDDSYVRETPALAYV